MISQIILDEEEVKARQLEQEKRKMSGMWDSDDEDLGFGSEDESECIIL